jgi:hypothetical protein
VTATLFAVTFPLTVPFWLLMIVLPRWRVTGRVGLAAWLLARRVAGGARTGG